MLLLEFIMFQAPAINEISQNAQGVITKARKRENTKRQVQLYFPILVMRSQS